jgi:LPXTG-site transpeptidase (sortase) family protein
MKTKPRPAYIVLGISVLLLVSSSVWFTVAGLGSSSNQDSVQVVNAGTSRVDTDQPNTNKQRATATPRSPAARIGVVVPERARVSGPAPIALEIPSIDVVSQVIPVGVDADQQVVIPEDISQVGWYRFGATPGTGVGSSVIVGHRDGRNFGVGAFYDLERLDVGDPISLTNEAGERVTYQVTGVESVKKAKLPFRELFRETGAETLTLISCIGYYEPGVGYEANIIVSAVPSASVNNSSIDSQKS